jgi:hypothetical protein
LDVVFNTTIDAPCCPGAMGGIPLKIEVTL